MSINASIPLNFLQALAQDRVKRWHVVEVGREQRLMEHVGGVTLIVDHIMEICEPGAWEHVFALRWALYHDAHEVVMGDRPTCAKMYGDIAKYECEQLSDIKRELGASAPWVGKIIELADSLEAYRFLLRNPVGMHSKKVAAEISQRVGKCIDEYVAFRLNQNDMARTFLYQLRDFIGEDQ